MAEKKPEPEKAAPKKSNLPLILGLIGCGGLLFIGCCAGGSFGIYRFLLKAEPSHKGGAGAVGVAAQNRVVDAKARDKEDDKNWPTGNLRKYYDQIQFDMHFDQIVALAGSKGERIMPGDMPSLAEKGLQATIGKGIREHRVNHLFEWHNEKRDQRVVVGYAEDLVVFKAFFYMVGNQDRVEYAFRTPKK
jgi:hypothetical protein